MSRVVQLLPDLVFGDAVSNDCLFLDRVLREAGFEVELLVERADGRYHDRTLRIDLPVADVRLPQRVDRRAIPPRTFTPGDLRPDDLVILHYSTWSATAGWVLRARLERLVLVYHNVTPPALFGSSNLDAARANLQAIDSLPGFGAIASLAIAKSEYSERELRSAGFRHTAVVPLAVELSVDAPYSVPAYKAWQRPGVVMLSVGRIAPNKRIEDAIHVLAAYRERIGDAWLLLVGAQDTAPAYRMWLGHLVGYLGLDARVAFAGHVSREELMSYYRAADVYLCMSEHEGFCVPLVEALALGVPVLANESSAIPLTLGGAGVLMKRRHPVVAAELVDRLAHDVALRGRLVEAGRARAREFAPERVARRFLEVIAGVAGLVTPVAG